jgi:hypothetical protein
VNGRAAEAQMNADWDASEKLSNVKVAQSATAPTEPVFPPKPLLIALGGVIGRWFISGSFMLPSAGDSRLNSGAMEDRSLSFRSTSARDSVCAFSRDRNPTISEFIFPAVTAVAFLAGVIEINTSAFVWYALFVAMGTLSTALSPSPHVSVLSLGFIVVAQFPYGTRELEGLGRQHQMVGGSLATLPRNNGIVGSRKPE